jgi:hypothetical protein
LHRFSPIFAYFRIILHRFSAIFGYFCLFSLSIARPQQQHPGDQDNQADVSGADHLSECGAAHCGTGCVAENGRKFGGFGAYFWGF